ncbi:hypothetical protein EJB05_13690, partial [Eragrostis curvula]
MGEEAAAAPLLRDFHLHGGGDGGGEKAEELPATRSRWWLEWDAAEAAGQLAFAAPMVVTSMAYFAIPLVSVMYAGRLGELELAAATLGNSWGTVTGIALMVYCNDQSVLNLVTVLNVSDSFEYWSIEMLVLLAGLMPESKLSTSIIAMCENTQAVSYMITYGFAAVISTRVSNELGAGNIANAKKALTVSLSLSLLLAVAFLLLLGLGHDLWASLFSNSQKVVSAFASMTPLLIGSVVLDSTQGVLSGVARGCGWQHMAAWTNLLAFYIVGLPLALLFGFTLGLHIKGLWLGQICGLLCQNCVLLFITLRTNWEKIDLTTLNQENDFFC